MNDDYDMTDLDLDTVEVHRVPCRYCGKEFEAEGRWVQGEVMPTFDGEEEDCEACR